MYVCKCMCMHVCVHKYMHVHTYVCMCGEQALMSGAYFNYSQLFEAGSLNEWETYPLVALAVHNFSGSFGPHLPQVYLQL